MITTAIKTAQGYFIPFSQEIVATGKAAIRVDILENLGASAAESVSDNWLVNWWVEKETRNVQPAVNEEIKGSLTIFAFLKVTLIFMLLNLFALIFF